MINREQDGKIFILWICCVAYFRKKFNRKSKRMLSLDKGIYKCNSKSHSCGQVVTFL